MLRLLAILALLLGHAGPAAGQAQQRARQTSAGINLAGPADWNTELPFVDAFRMSRPWISQREGAGWGKGPPLDLDAHGYVQSLADGCFAETPVLTIPSGRYPKGHYTLLYDGVGRFEFNGSNATVIEREPGRIIVDITGRGSVFIRLLEVDFENYPTNIRFVMPGFEDSYETEPFHPIFLARWHGMAAVRFMDWMHTNNSTIATWQDRPTRADATWSKKGVPLEVMIDLANRLETDAWFCMPHLATDDYVSRFAGMVDAQLDHDRVVYVEYSNEVWNGQFQQQRHAGDAGLDLGIGQNHWDAGWHFYAKRSIEMFDIWSRVFGDAAGERMVRVLATQAGNPYVAEQILKFEVDGKPAGEQADALAIAPYFGINVRPTGGDAENPSADIMEDWAVDNVVAHLRETSIPRTVEWIDGNKQHANRYGLTLICYEAGQHAVGTQGGENVEAITKLLHAANRSDAMGDLYDDYLAAWQEADGGLMCLFSSIGTFSKWGSWGLAEHYDDAPSDYGKYAAVIRWAKSLGQPVNDDPTAAE